MTTIDACACLGQALFGYGQSTAELLTRLNAAEIEQAVVYPAKPRGYHLGPANDLVAETTFREPRLRGLARVDPNLGDEALAELERAVQSLGVCGLFLHPWEENFRINAPLADPLLRRCAELGLPVLIAAGYPWVAEASQIGDLARRFPSVQIVMTHGGQFNISGLGQADALLVLRKYPNVSMETSGVYRQDFLEDVVAELGAGRVVFGSNSPRMDPRLEVQRVRWANLSESEKGLILGGNAARLFRLKSGASAPRS